LREFFQEFLGVLAQVAAVAVHQLQFPLHSEGGPLRGVEFNGHVRPPRCSAGTRSGCTAHRTSGSMPCAQRIAVSLPVARRRVWRTARDRIAGSAKRRFLLDGEKTRESHRARGKAAERALRPCRPVPFGLPSPGRSGRDSVRGDGTRVQPVAAEHCNASPPTTLPKEPGNRSEVTNT